MTNHNEVFKPRVFVHFIQDTSGSMAGCWGATVAGFATFVRKLQEEDNVDYQFALTLFDTRVTSVMKGVPIATVNPNLLRKYVASGGTALYDALGEAIQNSDLLEADKVIFVIVTDGAENSSLEWTKDSLHSAVDAKIRADKYTFQYLGAQPESWDDSSKIGIMAGQTVRYDQQHTQSMYSCVGDALNNFSMDTLTTSTRSMTQTYGSAESINAANLQFDPKDRT